MVDRTTFRKGAFPVASAPFRLRPSRELESRNVWSGLPWRRKVTPHHAYTSGGYRPFPSSSPTAIKGGPFSVIAGQQPLPRREVVAD